MTILDVKEVTFPEVKVIKFAWFVDERGFFTETYRKSDFQKDPRLSFLGNKEFVQSNVSFSKKGVFRGLHFQWEPAIDKLVRVQEGRMIDLFLDIRKGSPTYGKISGYDMSTKDSDDQSEWIWVPKGFAHGSLYLIDTMIEYFCDAEWNPKTEASISPFSKDIDWSLIDPALKKHVENILHNNPLVSEKDKNGFTLEQWKNSKDAENFIYSS